MQHGYRCRARRPASGVVRLSTTTWADFSRSSRTCPAAERDVGLIHACEARAPRDLSPSDQVGRVAETWVRHEPSNRGGLEDAGGSISRGQGDATASLYTRLAQTAHAPGSG